MPVVPPFQETPLEVRERAPFRYGWTYWRSTDSRQSETRGQDALIVDADDTGVRFALCDGVGQSYFGELAADLVSQSLIRWLAECDPHGPLDRLEDGLHDCFAQLLAQGSELVEKHSLAGDTPALLKAVLEQKRALGSETNFVGGRFDWPTAQCPHGLLLAVWLGDCKIRLWSGRGERDLGGAEAFETRHRWSTRKGFVGANPALMRLIPQSAECLTGLCSYSDGFGLLDGLPDLPGPAQIECLRNQAAGSAASDDISFFFLETTGQWRL